MPYPSKIGGDRVLAAAVGQLEREGLRQLSLRSLAASLEVAPTALYRYFADKSVLEAALAGEAARLLHTAMQRAVRKGDAQQTIRGIARAYLAFARRRPYLYELLLLPCDEEREEASPHQALWDFVVEHVGALTGTGRADEASVALWAYLHGISQLEAIRVYGAEKPGVAGSDFGLEAWLSAASAGSPKSD